MTRCPHPMPSAAALVVWCVCAAVQALAPPANAVRCLHLLAALQRGPASWQCTLAWGLRSRWLAVDRDVLQRFEDSCGAASLHMLLAPVGIPWTQELIWSLTRLPGGGTTLQHLADAAARFGTACEIGHFEDVREVPVPAVLHLRRKHFVVLHELDQDVALILDPAFGSLHVEVSALQQQVSGAVMICSGQPWVGSRHPGERACR